MKKIPSSRSAPPGLEWTILRRLPQVTVGLAAALIMARWLAGFWVTARAGMDAMRRLQQIDYAFYGLGFTLVFFLGVIAIACVVITIAKGPQYTADSYPLSDAERPG